MKTRPTWAGILLVCIAVTLIPNRSRAEEASFISLERRDTPRRLLPTNVTVISKSEIEKSGAKSLPEALKMVPGVDVNESGSIGSYSNIRIRGVPSSNQVQILIDGQPLTGVSVQNVDSSLIPMEDVERIEIIRGGASVLYGANSVGGAIHIITKTPDDVPLKAEVKADGGTYATQSYAGHISARGNLSSARATGEYLESDGFQDNADLIRRYGSGNVGYSFGNGLRLEADASHLDQDQGSPSGTPVPFDQWDGSKEKEANTPNAEIEKRQNRQRIKADIPLLGGVLKTEGFQSRDNLVNRPSSGAAPSSDIENIIRGGDARFLSGNGPVLGVAYERDERETVGKNPHHVVNWGTYINHRFNLGGLEVFPGFRFDQHSAYGNQYNPRLTLTYLANNSVKFSGNVGRAFRAPTLVDLYEDFIFPSFPAFNFYGNPELDPEISWSYDLGSEVELNPNFLFNITGYYSRIRDRITAVDLDNNGINETLGNTSIAEISGLESGVTWVMGIMTNGISYGYTRARGSSASSSGFVPLRLTPEHMINYTNEINFMNQITLVNRIRYESHQYALDGETGFRLPSFGVWDGRLQKKCEFGTAYVAVNNITDKRYVESVTFGNGVPMPGRNVRVGLSVSFPRSYLEPKG